MAIRLRIPRSPAVLSLVSLLGLALLSILNASAQPAVGVVILPFTVHAQPDLAYLQGEVPEAVRQQFAEDGANARVLDAETAAAWRQAGRTDADLARAALQVGADFVIDGSLTFIGQSFSLDARLISAAGDRAPRVFTAVGQGVENLPAAVRKLARDIGLTVFQRDRVAEVTVEGSQRIEADAIRRVIKTKPGDIFTARGTADDLKAVFGMGYFDDVQVRSERTAEGIRLVYQVTEKPTVRTITVSGYTVYDEDELRKSLTLKKGAVLNVFAVRSDVRRLEDMYKEKNYHNVKVDYTLSPQRNNQVDVEYRIDEGSKLLIKNIAFIGNTAFPDRTLKGEIDTSEKKFFLSWFTRAGDLNQDIVNQDAGKLQAFYHNNGYIRARVGEPQVDFEEDGIVITFRINEGPRFKLGTIDFRGDLLLPKEELVKKLKVVKEPYYNREVLRSDVIAITDLYSDEGYAYVDVSPKVDQDNEKLVANITFQIDKGKQVYFERIQISGNTKTRDKVIRRELRVHEEELYSGVRLKRGIRNLNRLEYFENVKVDTTRGSGDDRMNMNLEVKEKSTGAFTIGAGYGTSEGGFVTGSVRERNLFGRGQILGLQGILGGKTQRYSVSFTEPWLFDIPLSAGIELYKWKYEFDQYDKDSVGGKLRFGYPLHEYVRGNATYTLDVTDIRNIEPDAARSIQNDEGLHLKSSISPMIRYDSRDSLFNAREGSIHSLEYEFAGLGGDVGFNKFVADTGWYLPLWKLVFVPHARAGWMRGMTGWDVPDYEKFYLGGINSVRGGDRNDLAPKQDGEPVGGMSFLQGNFEVKFPLVEEANVFGILFVDAGQVWHDDFNSDFGNTIVTVGPEIRWMSPIGPIRLAYGWYLTQKSEYKSSGGFEFSMASAF